MVTPSTARIVNGIPRLEYERLRWHTQPEEKKKASVEKIKAWTKAQTPEYLYYVYLRNKASKNGIEFNLKPEDIIFPEYCPILGTKILPRGQSKRNINAFSTDRIDNTKGYVKGNVQFISKQANTMKSNASPEELLKFADWVYANYKRT